MKKILSIALVAALCLCLSAAAFAAGTHAVTIINGMDGSVYDTYEVADGEDLVFTISCAAPADMGPVAAGEAGSGVTTTVGTITYSNITLGGPNQYPTAETVTITGINADATVTITPNPLEADGKFPTVTEGAAAAGGGSGEASDVSGEPSGEPSGEASGEASDEPSDEPYPKFDEYKVYLYETLLKDTFWQGKEDQLQADIGAAETPYDENLQHFTGSGEVDQAPAGVVFPMTYDAWYAENGGSASGEAQSVEDAYIEYLHEWLIAEDEVNSTMTEDIRENEFMPLIRAWDFESYPVDMLWNGMLETGCPMTFEEFAAAQ